MPATLDAVLSGIANGLRDSGLGDETSTTFTAYQMISELQERKFKGIISLTDYTWTFSGLHLGSSQGELSFTPAKTIKFVNSYVNGEGLKINASTPITELGQNGYNGVISINQCYVHNLFRGYQGAGMIQHVKSLAIFSPCLLVQDRNAEDGSAVIANCYYLVTAPCVATRGSDFSLYVGNSTHPGYLSLILCEQVPNSLLSKIKAYIGQINFTRDDLGEDTEGYTLRIPTESFNIQNTSTTDSIFAIYAFLKKYDYDYDRKVIFVGPGSGTARWGSSGDSERRMSSWSQLARLGYGMEDYYFTDEPLVIFENFDSVDWSGENYKNASFSDRPPQRYRTGYEKFYNSAVLAQNPDGSYVYAYDLLPDPNDIPWEEGSGS